MSAKRPGFEFWDERYAAPGFAYGTTPSRWLEARASDIRPGGALIIEAFTTSQLGRPSGGPRQADLLYEIAIVRADFPGVGKARPSRGHVDQES